MPIETVFVPRTRKEIKCCEWFSIEHLPTHKTDPVSRNHLGINANSFFMIMPFVKSLKKWINEQTQGGNQMSKKSKGCESKHIVTTAGVINNSNALMALNERNDSKSPSTVFFKNNAGHRRQRHKSMGDFDSVNVLMHESTGDIQSSKQCTNNNNKTISTTPNGTPNANCAGKPIGGKRKLFAIEQTSTKRSSSPFMSNFQLQPIIANGNVKQMPANNLLKMDSNRKKKNHTKPQRTGSDQDGDESENECQASGEQKWLFNPPKLSQLLCREPNIANWSNVRLNKDSIMQESLK